jgi:hypothetical protein
VQNDRVVQLFFSKGTAVEPSARAPRERFFRQASTSPTGLDWARVVAGDFNRDGQDDLLVSGLDGKMSLLEFDPDGVPYATHATAIPASGRNYRVGDIDGDGLLDVIVQGSSDLTVYFQDGERPDRIKTIHEGTSASTQRSSTRR